ncbi:heme O synthase-like polyprenyltransferase [Arthrobacter sp. 1088]|nr:heme O synthase-like polyprenyltransferase [Arthrobacter sp. 1088]
MNPDVGRKPSQQPRTAAEKSAFGVTQILFRAFLLSALGSFFVFSLNVNYVWLSAILTIAGLVLGIVVLVRSVKYKHPRLVLFGTISGLVVSAIMCLLILTSVLFFKQVTTYQDCARSALTESAKTQCLTQLEDSMPGPVR